MVNILFCGIFLVAALLGFGHTLNFGMSQRAYLGIYRGLIDKSVVVFDDKGTYLTAPFFDIPSLKTDLGNYFKANLNPYCMAYQYEVVPLSAFEAIPTSIRIDLFIKVSPLFEKDYKAYFALERNR